jgi:L-galactose dehydrogenase
MTLPVVELGRTGMVVTAAGLGCGGHSRLGQRQGASFDESVTIVRRAIDLGVTFIDTARAYGTEEIVGAGVHGHRDAVVISSKSQAARDGVGIQARELRESVALSLTRLGTDYIDVFHLHGVPLAQYRHCRDELVPELFALRDEGKIRFLAISEVFGADPGHAMLKNAALADDCWDVMMVGFNLLNQSARERVFVETQKQNIGVLIMFAVRRALSQPDELRRVVADLIERGEVDADAVDRDDPLGFLTTRGGAASVVDAAYRFARHEPGAHVVLTGTGNVAHLEENLESLARGPLPDGVVSRLGEMFGGVDSISGN